MSKHDLAARPSYHHKRESIDAHLTIVLVAPAAGRLIEDRTGWSTHKFVHTARRCRAVQIQAGQRVLAAEDPLPADLRDALALIARPELRTNLSQVGYYKCADIGANSAACCL